MINNLSDLVSAIKTWWHAPIKLERKRPEAMTPEEFKKLPSSVFDILNMNPMSKYRTQYYDELRAKLRTGQKLTAEERYRLRMHDHVHQINDSLDHSDE